jgi:hypothetical protein
MEVARTPSCHVAATLNLARCLCCLFLHLQSYVAQLLPATSSDPGALSMAALQGATLVQINSSAAVLALAKSAGFDTVQAFMPGLQMFWDDVSVLLAAVAHSQIALLCLAKGNTGQVSSC